MLAGLPTRILTPYVLGVVHKLRWQEFGIFWPPTPLCWHFLWYKCWQNWADGILTGTIQKHPIQIFKEFWSNRTSARLEFMRDLFVLFTRWLYQFTNLFVRKTRVISHLPYSEIQNGQLKLLDRRKPMKKVSKQK